MMMEIFKIIVGVISISKAFLSCRKYINNNTSIKEGVYQCSINKFSDKNNSTFRSLTINSSTEFQNLFLTVNYNNSFHLNSRIWNTLEFKKILFFYKEFNSENIHNEKRKILKTLYLFQFKNRIYMLDFGNLMNLERKIFFFDKTHYRDTFMF